MADAECPPRVHGFPLARIAAIFSLSCDANFDMGICRYAGKGTWDEFIKIHAETLSHVDFFSKMVVAKTGLKQALVLAFLRVESRRVICSPATFKPDESRMVYQADAMLEQAKATGLPIRHLVRDKDFKYSKGFDAVFECGKVAILPTAPPAPNQPRRNRRGFFRRA